jgi:hypothetical protein
MFTDIAEGPSGRKKLPGTAPLSEELFKNVRAALDVTFKKNVTSLVCTDLIRAVLAPLGLF